jgi:hypothetical protein
MNRLRAEVSLLDLITLACFAITAIFLIVRGTAASWSVESIFACTVLFPPFWVGCVAWCISSR